MDGTPVKGSPAHQEDARDRFPDCHSMQPCAKHERQQTGQKHCRLPRMADFRQVHKPLLAHAPA